MSKIIFKTNSEAEKKWKAERVQHKKANLKTNYVNTTTAETAFARAFEKLTQERGHKMDANDVLYPAGTVQTNEKEDAKLKRLQEAADQEGILLPCQFNKAKPTKQAQDDEILMPCGY